MTRSNTNKFLNNFAQVINRWQNFALMAISSTAMASGMTLVTQSAALAQAAYGSYIGVGASLGLTEDGNDDSAAAGVAAIRYKFLRAPISARAQVFIGDDVAIVPTVSYDFPLSWQADAYIGAGVSIVPGSDNTPVGDNTSFAIQPGIDYALPNSDLVIFGNAIISFDGYEDGGAAASVQGGLGLRF
jgi:hypothetical protein